MSFQKILEKYRKTECIDAKIDQRVYALYGLTEEEIKIVVG